MRRRSFSRNRPRQLLADAALRRLAGPPRALWRARSRPGRRRHPPRLVGPREEGAAHRLRPTALTRIAFETRHLVELFHPADALGRLNLHLRGDQVGVVERRGLDIDLAGENRLVRVEEPGAAVAAEMAAAMLGRCIRSEEHTSELHSLMRRSYAVF